MDHQVGRRPMIGGDEVDPTPPTDARQPTCLNNYKATIEYDGREFVGFQLQARGRTVQGVVERAIADVVGADTRIHPAGRTDSGVHASGQVISFALTTRLEPPALRMAINARLPVDAAIIELETTTPDFHARFSASARHYRYTIWASRVRSPLRDRRAWHVRQLLNVEAMRGAAEMLIGVHDFAALSAHDPAIRSTVRRLTRLDVAATTTANGQEITVQVSANAFLPRMVRNIVGLLVAVGAGRLDIAAVAPILASRDRQQAPPAAPAKGLCLVAVSYDRPDDRHPMAVSGTPQPSNGDLDSRHSTLSANGEPPTAPEEE